MTPRSPRSGRRWACPACSTCTRTSCPSACCARCGRTSTPAGRWSGGRGRSATGAPTTSGPGTCGRWGCGGSPPWRTRTAPAWPPTSTRGPSASPPGTPGCVPSATFFPEPAFSAIVDAALAGGAGSSRCTCRSARTTRTTRCWSRSGALLAETGTPVVVHAGSGPVANGHTGPGPFGEVLRRHPALAAVIAHFGAPEYEGFLDLADRYANVMLDTTMVFTTFFPGFPAGAPPQGGGARPGRPGAARQRLPRTSLTRTRTSSTRCNA